MKDNYINKFIDDHRKYNCNLFKIENKTKKAFFIINRKRIIKNKINSVQVIFSNDYNFLLENIFFLNFWFFVKYNSFFITFSLHNIKNFQKKPFWLKRNSRKFILNTNNSKLLKEDLEKIDLLYTELIFQNCFN